MPSPPTLFLTWNLANNSHSLRQQALKALVADHDFAIIVLQEAPGQGIVAELDGLGYDVVQQSGKEVKSGVRIFFRKGAFKQLNTTHSTDKTRKLVAAELQSVTGSDSFVVAAVHLYSKRQRSEREQLWRNHQLLQTLYAWEQTISTRRIILVGDFNANPYEANLRDPFLLRGHEERALIRQFQAAAAGWLGGATPFWYNPMWHLLSDYAPTTAATRAVTGSYYWFTDETGPTWNLYDGFLVRESLMNDIVHSELEVLVRAGVRASVPADIIEFLKPSPMFGSSHQQSLIAANLPDHLPVKFALTSL